MPPHSPAHSTQEKKIHLGKSTLGGWWDSHAGPMHTKGNSGSSHLDVLCIRWPGLAHLWISLNSLEEKLHYPHQKASLGEAWQESTAYLRANGTYS